MRDFFYEKVGTPAAVAGHLVRLAINHDLESLAQAVAKSKRGHWSGRRKPDKVSGSRFDGHDYFSM